MSKGRYVSYLRVSTDRQGKSGLGLEAQRKATAPRMNPLVAECPGPTHDEAVQR